MIATRTRPTRRFAPNATVGFAAGDANLYRYVGNSPTNAVDPSGLQQRSDLYDLRKYHEERIKREQERNKDNPDCFTEATARKVIQDEIERFRKSRWHFAANLLEHFLKNNGKDYRPTEVDIDEAKKFLGSNMFNIIREHIEKLRKEGKLDWQGPNAISLDDGILWPKASGLSTNNALFFALGGYKYKITGTMKFEAPIAGHSVLGGFKVSIKATITDKFAFPLTWIRMQFEAYRAGYYLVTCHKYREFEHRFEFSMDFVIPRQTLD